MQSHGKQNAYIYKDSGKPFTILKINCHSVVQKRLFFKAKTLHLNKIMNQHC
jgi:hypothetical protein